MDRHPPLSSRGRCCWICGKPGGTGFTQALRLAGYDVMHGQIGYAHADCMSRAKQRAGKVKQSAPISEVWKVHTPNLLNEILKNKGTEALELPLKIFGNLLHEVATRASELNDPALNTLMLRLTLYEASDPEKHSSEEIAAAYASQRAA